MVNGTGCIFYGKRNYRTDGILEELDTTQWLAVVWLPIVPLKSVSIARKRRADLISSMARNIWWSETIHVLGRRPLDWSQIALTYLKAYGSILAIAAIIGVLDG